MLLQLPHCVSNSKATNSKTLDLNFGLKKRQHGTLSSVNHWHSKRKGKTLQTDEPEKSPPNTLMIFLFILIKSALKTKKKIHLPIIYLW